MALEILKNKEAWDILKPTLLKRFNIPYGYVNGAPESYPCIALFFPCTDVNGFSARGVFISVQMAEELIQYKDNLRDEFAEAELERVFGKNT